MRRVAALGAGSWGTAFVKVMADAGREVVLWARHPEVAAAINDDHRNPDLPGIQPDVATALGPTDAVHDGGGGLPATAALS